MLDQECQAKNENSTGLKKKRGLSAPWVWLRGLGEAVLEDRFMDYVAQAARAVAHESSLLVLLAIKPKDPETDYGYVVPSK